MSRTRSPWITPTRFPFPGKKNWISFTRTSKKIGAGGLHGASPAPVLELPSSVAAYFIEAIMMSKSCVLCRRPVSLSDPGPVPKAYNGEAVCVWLPQPTRR